MGTPSCCLQLPTSLTVSQVCALAMGAGCFDHQLHLWDPQQPELVAQYLLAVDALVRAAPAKGQVAAHLASAKRAPQRIHSTPTCPCYSCTACLLIVNVCLHPPPLHCMAAHHPRCAAEFLFLAV